MERITAEVQDAYFDYDQFDIRDDARAVLAADANAIKAIFQDFPTASIVVEGHCDERGSAEYNLGLGDRRAQAARNYLIQLGVPADGMSVISYGKERPQCTESNESCWQQNRRAHFAQEVPTPRRRKINNTGAGPSFVARKAFSGVENTRRLESG